MATRPGAADDAELLKLLWRRPGAQTPRGPGRKASLTLDAILGAGIALADDRDSPALSMRLVADRLGCTPMALYSHVANKQALLRLMYDRVHAEFPDLAGPDPSARVRAWADALADLYARHHWLTEVSWARPVLGPHEQAVLESLLAHLEPLFLPADRARAVVSALFALARNTGRLIGDARHAERTLPEATWWATHSAAFQEAAPDFPGRFPLSAALGAAPRPAPLPEEGTYLERTARAELHNAVLLLLAGAASP
ncbi:TetR family transcriptional regulator [Actinocorallia herbida]|uniref:TetR family transcriptional regulator n=1 Tax=Actinocorallia herbida TaxID=58109 RepID=A0A3N1D542_9ACTN|nr:TetR/AcrR family transcriptional regulator C-terminal domain-containing protein [Actinocorallia herbida]ROO88198.1 TetR family transcriptional regulator [Actinocorallia herbida]